MRRTVATLLVVATALVMAVPVGASEAPPAGPAAPLPATPTALQAPTAPVPAPVTVAPLVPAPVAAVEAVAPAAPAVARPAVRSLRGKVPSRTRPTDDAYAAQLQAELCRARTIFCGLDHGGRYPGR